MLYLHRCSGQPAFGRAGGKGFPVPGALSPLIIVCIAVSIRLFHADRNSRPVVLLGQCHFLDHGIDSVGHVIGAIAFGIRQGAVSQDVSVQLNCQFLIVRHGNLAVYQPLLGHRQAESAPRVLVDDFALRCGIGDCVLTCFVKRFHFHSITRSGKIRHIDHTSDGVAAGRQCGTVLIDFSYRIGANGQIGNSQLVFQGNSKDLICADRCGISQPVHRNSIFALCAVAFCRIGAFNSSCGNVSCVRRHCYIEQLILVGFIQFGDCGITGSAHDFVIVDKETFFNFQLSFFTSIGERCSVNFGAAHCSGIVLLAGSHSVHCCFCNSIGHPCFDTGDLCRLVMLEGNGQFTVAVSLLGRDLRTGAVFIHEYGNILIRVRRLFGIIVLQFDCEGIICIQIRVHTGYNRFADIQFAETCVGESTVVDPVIRIVYFCAADGAGSYSIRFKRRHKTVLSGFNFGNSEGNAFRDIVYLCRLIVLQFQPAKISTVSNRDRIRLTFRYIVSIEPGIDLYHQGSGKGNGRPASLIREGQVECKLLRKIGSIVRFDDLGYVQFAHGSGIGDSAAVRIAAAVHRIGVDLQCAGLRVFFNCNGQRNDRTAVNDSVIGEVSALVLCVFIELARVVDSVIRNLFSDGIGICTGFGICDFIEYCGNTVRCAGGYGGVVRSGHRHVIFAYQNTVIFVQRVLCFNDESVFPFRGSCSADGFGDLRGINRLRIYQLGHECQNRLIIIRQGIGLEGHVLTLYPSFGSSNNPFAVIRLVNFNPAITVKVAVRIHFRHADCGSCPVVFSLQFDNACLGNCAVNSCDL